MDTCGTAGDGVCQDGGWAASGSMCELGTDCSDCGARPAAVPVLDPVPAPPLPPGVAGVGGEAISGGEATSVAPAPPLPPGVAGVGGVATSGGEATSVGGEAASVSGATQDAGSGLAIGLAITAIGLALLVAMLGTRVTKRRTHDTRATKECTLVTRYQGTMRTSGSEALPGSTKTALRATSYQPRKL